MYRKNVFVFFFLMSAVIFLNGCSDPRYVSEKLFWKAEKQFSAIAGDKNKELSPQDFARIISGYEAVIKTYPLENLAAKAHFKISTLYLAQKKYDQARNELKTVIQNFSANSSLAASAQFSIAKTYELQGEEETALAEFEKIPALYPLTSLGLQTPLYVMQYLEKTSTEEKVREYYLLSIRRYQGLVNDYSGTSIAPRIKKHMALAHLSQDKLEPAIDIYDSIIKDLPQSRDAVEAYIAKAEIYSEKMNDIPSAITVYEELIADYSGLLIVSAAKAQLGWLYLKKGEVSRAEELFRAVKMDEKADEQTKLNASLGLASVYREQKNTDRAVKTYDEIRSEFPKSKVAIAAPFLISQIYSEAEDKRAGEALDNAIDIYRAARKSSPYGEAGRAAAHYLVLSYLKKKEPDQALIVLKDLAAAYPDNPGYMLDMASIYAMLKEQDKAIDIYSALIDKYTNNEYLVNLSRSKIEQIHSLSPDPDASDTGLE